MSESQGNEKGGAEVSAAVRWLCRSIDDRSEMSAQERTEWEQWASDASNAQELQRVEALWDRLGTLPATGFTVVEEPEDDYDEDIPVAVWLQQRERKRATSRRGRTNTWAMAACGVFAASLLAWYFTTHFHVFASREFEQRYSTVAAEHRTIDLEDGSRITLGARTELSTHYTVSQRIVFLERGEALFNVTHDRRRPFTVLAGAGAITAIGTQFNVLRDPDANLDRVTVTVTNGAVEVGPPQELNTKRGVAGQGSADPALWTPAKLVKGQELTYDVKGPEGQVKNADLETAAAWKDGRLEYRHTPLSVVIPRVSRYSAIPIVLADSLAGDLQFSGTVFEGQVDEWLRALQTAYPIEIVQSTDRIVIRSREVPPRPPNP